MTLPSVIYKFDQNNPRFLMLIYTYLYLKCKPAMKRSFTPALVTLIMLIGILGITNPGFRQPYKLFGNVEGKLVHNYFIFSVYQQYDSHTLTDNKKYITYRRYIGIVMNFFEIGPLREEQKDE